MSDLFSEAMARPSVRRAKACHEFTKAYAATMELGPQLDHVAQAMLASSVDDALAQAEAAEAIWAAFRAKLREHSTIRRVK